MEYDTYSMKPSIDQSSTTMIDAEQRLTLLRRAKTRGTAVSLVSRYLGSYTHTSVRQRSGSAGSFEIIQIRKDIDMILDDLLCIIKGY